MEIKLVKNGDGTYEKVELVDAELENGSVVQIVNSRETLDGEDFENVDAKINDLQIEKAEMIKLQDVATADTIAYKESETHRIDALLAPLLALKTKYDVVKEIVAEEIVVK